MQNKPKVKYAKINITSIVTMRYEIMDLWLFRQNKPNSKPIKPKTKPIQTQNKPNSNPIKPICRKGKNERFCVDKEPYNDINNTTRGIYHPSRVPISNALFPADNEKLQKIWLLDREKCRFHRKY